MYEMLEDKGISRRNAVFGSAAFGGILLLSSAARAQRSAGLIESYARPRQLKDVDHAVVYRNEKQFCAWPHTRGFWNFEDGELMQSLDAVAPDYASTEAIHQHLIIERANVIGG